MNLHLKHLKTPVFPLVLAALSTSAALGQVTLPSTYALPVSAAVTTAPGFYWNVSEVLANEPNQLVWAEAQLAGLEGQNFASPSATGEDASGPAAPANPVTAPISFQINTFINFSIVDADTSKLSATPPLGVTQEDQMPGLPGTGGNNGTDNIAAEALTYLDLPAGAVTMGVRSDDGFSVTIGGAAPSDHFSSEAKLVGKFDGGRGAADTTFSFIVPQAGLYATRLVYENGGGDANIEWYTVKSNGDTVLVNDTANGGIPAYRSVNVVAGAYASSLLPSPGSTGASPTPTVSATLVDGATPISASSITMTINGTAVTPVIARSGSSTTVSYTATTILPSSSVQNVSVAYMDGAKARTNSWSFTIGYFATLTSSQVVVPNTAKPGFKFSVFANSAMDGFHNEAFNNDQRDFAEQSLNLIYNDWSDETMSPLPLLPNLANVNAVGSASGAAAALPAVNAAAEFVIPGTINFTATMTPGLPATDGMTDGANGELLTYVTLPAGLTTFVVTSSDLYRAYVGSWDYTTGIPAAHLNVYGATDTSFFVNAPVAGVYPMRIVWNHVDRNDPSLLISTLDAQGNKHTLNDTAHGGLATYSALATPSEPYIKFTSPSPVLRQLAYSSYALVVNIADGDIGVDDSSPALTLDGKPVTVTKTRVGDFVSLTYNPTTLQIPTELHTATLAFKDKAGKALSETWTFMNLKAIWLPANWVTGDNFDEYPGDGTVFNTPATAWSTNWSNPVQPNLNWYTWSYTYRQNMTEDLTDPTSDSYLGWVVAPIDTFSGIEGDSLNINPQETLNGAPVANLVSGNFWVSESDNRTGAVTEGQEQFGYSKSFNLTTVSNPVVAFSSIYKQNQDSLGAIEYSVDGGTNWFPVVYYLDGGSYKSDRPDVFTGADGSADAVTDFTYPQGDAPIWTDWYGHLKGGNYGDGIAAPITQALGPFMAPRINDDKFEGKRIEAVRLPFAAGKSDVRLRFSQLGTCSWYIGVDNLGFYDIAPSGAVVPTGVATVTVTPLVTGVTLNGTTVTVTFQGGTLQSSPSLSNQVWTSTGNSTGSYTETATGTKFFRVRQ